MTQQYWNRELETKDWREVQRWQAGRIGAAVPAMRARSAMYGELLASLPGEQGVPGFEALAELPFTFT